MTMRWSVAFGMMALMGCGTAVNNTGMSGELDSGVTGGGGNTCNEACAAQGRANCSAFQMGNCVSGCQSSLTMFPQCASAINAVSRCLASATYTCSSPANTPTTMGCRTETAAFVQCVTADAGP